MTAENGSEDTTEEAFFFLSLVWFSALYRVLEANKVFLKNH